MKHIFFNIEEPLFDVSNAIYKSLGVPNFLEGESAHAKGGIYYSHKIFGLEIKLECNSYDFDDRYNFMLTVKTDPVSGLSPDDQLAPELANIVIRLLKRSIQTDIAYEDKNGALRLYSDLTRKAFEN
jgi:hypothetical protein